MTIVELSTRVNPVVSAVLRSRAHWLLSRGLMLITVTGRKSGRVYTIPVGYHETEDAIIVLVSEAHKKKWWRNYRSPGKMGLLLRGKPLEGTAHVLPPESPEFRCRADASLRRARFMPRLFGIDFDREKGLTDAQVQKLGEDVAIVEIVVAKATP